MGIIFAQLGAELPARHLVGIEPSSTVGEAAQAVREAFKLPDDGEVLLFFAGGALDDPAATMAGGEVPADAVLEAVRV
jgi:hypothetical protein